MTYQEIRKKHQEEYNRFSNNYVFYAFNEKQFKEGMERLGLKEDETSKIIRFTGGAYILKEHTKELDDMLTKHHEEFKNLMYNDDNFTLEAFEYELGNHEYVITYENYETLNSLGLSEEEVYSNERLLKLFKLAKKNYLKEMEKFGW